MNERCHGCHKEFEDKPREEELKVQIKDKIIMIKGIIHKCPHCGEIYSTEKEAQELANKFEEECKRQDVE